jgi:hypothetical protein
MLSNAASNIPAAVAPLPRPRISYEAVGMIVVVLRLGPWNVEHVKLVRKRASWSLSAPNRRIESLVGVAALVAATDVVEAGLPFTQEAA